MEKTTKKIAIGAGIAAGIGTLAYFLTRQPPPGPPPGEDEGCIQGYVKNAITGAKIANAQIYVGQQLNCQSEPDGFYRTTWLAYGDYTITVPASDYESRNFPVTLSQEVLDMDLELRSSTTPTEWSEGLVVQGISVYPDTVYLGGVASVEVSISGPSDIFYPRNVHGTISVNGETVSSSCSMDEPTWTMTFSYVASRLGAFTVTAQDKTAMLNVVESPAGIYYSPYGGLRFPICTRLTLPEPIQIPSRDEPVIEIPAFWTGYGLPYQLDPYTIMPLGGGFFGCSKNQIEIVKAATPSAWYPATAIVDGYEIIESSAGIASLYPHYGAVVNVFSWSNCPHYWESKQELVEMIALPRIRNSCSNSCNVRFGGFWDDLGSGNKDPVRGLVGYDSPYSPYPWEIEKVSPAVVIVKLSCPYCNKVLESPATKYYEGYFLSMTLQMIDHIKASHPDHPFDEPPW